MPITCEVYKALYEGKSPKKVIYDLMTREEKSEEEFNI
jgi:glycerol-3-phosphate dehydrogenase